MEPIEPNRPAFQAPTSAMLNQLSLGRKVLLGSSLLLFIAYFLTWYVFDVEIFRYTVSGLSGLPALGFLILLALIGAAAAPIFGRNVKQFVQVAFSEGTLLFFGASAVAVLVILGGLISKPGEYSFGFGFFIAVLAALGVAAGGWLMKQAGAPASP
jgi:hypothetical protein